MGEEACSVTNTRTISIQMPSRKLIRRAFGCDLTHKQLNWLYDGVAKGIQEYIEKDFDWERALSESTKVVIQ